MALLYTIVEGWTDDLPFTLRKNGAALDLTGFTVTLKVRPVNGSVYIDTAGDVTVLDQTNPANKGKVVFTPDADDFKANKSPYNIRWQLTAGTKNAFVPNSKTGDTIEVVKP